MPLFRDNSRRTIGLAIATVFGGYYVATNMVPHSLQAFNLIQTIVAVLAVAALAALVTQHHRREGELLTQHQEEMILVGAFGLAWVAILIAFRAYRQPGGSGAAVGVVTPSLSSKGVERDTARNRVANSKVHRNGPYYGYGDARYVVEEWYY